MNQIPRFIRKLSILFGQERFASELDEEMAFHRAQVEDQLIAGGMTQDERVTRQCGSSAIRRSCGSKAKKWWRFGQIRYCRICVLRCGNGRRILDLPSRQS